MKIAVIGGIGSGKSTVLAMLRNAGETVIDCDEVYRNVKKNAQFKAEMLEEFGDVFTNGEVDNRKVSAIVLGNAAAVSRLNAIAHPFVRRDLDKRCAGKKRVFVEVQVFENGLLEDYFDKVWLIVGDRQTRVNRVVVRDDCDISRVESIMSLQPPDEDRIKAGYTVIVNDGPLRELQEKVNKKLKELG